MKRLENELDAMTSKRKDAEGRMVAERQERARAAELITAVQEEIEGCRSRRRCSRSGWTPPRAGPTSWA